MNDDNNTQNTFLGLSCEKQLPGSIFLVNGIQLKGKVDAHYEHTVIFSNISNSGK